MAWISAVAGWVLEGPPHILPIRLMAEQRTRSSGREGAAGTEEQRARSSGAAAGEPATLTTPGHVTRKHAGGGPRARRSRTRVGRERGAAEAGCGGSRVRREPGAAGWESTYCATWAPRGGQRLGSEGCVPRACPLPPTGSVSGLLAGPSRAGEVEGRLWALEGRCFFDSWDGGGEGGGQESEPLAVCVGYRVVEYCHPKMCHFGVWILSRRQSRPNKLLENFPLPFNCLKAFR